MMLLSKNTVTVTQRTAEEACEGTACCRSLGADGSRERCWVGHCGEAVAAVPGLYEMSLRTAYRRAVDEPLLLMDEVA